MTLERVVAALAAEGQAAREGQRYARTDAEAECYERQTRVIAYASTAAHLCLAHRATMCEMERRLQAIERQQRSPTAWGWGWLRWVRFW